MHTRRKFLVATAGAGAVALAGCTGGDDDNGDDGNGDGPTEEDLEIGEPDFDAETIRNDGGTFTVPVTNPASTAEVQVTLDLLDENEESLATYDQTQEIGEDSTVDFEFEVDAAPQFSGYDISAQPAGDM